MVKLFIDFDMCGTEFKINELFVNLFISQCSIPISRGPAVHAKNIFGLPRPAVHGRKFNIWTP